MTVTTLDQCPLLLGGDWVRDPTWPAQSVHNPSTGEALATVPLCGAPEVERAVGAAAAAYPAWRDTPPLERARVLFRYRDLLERNFNEVAQLITREHGKTLEEARGSLRRGIEVVEFASGIPTLLMGDSLENIAPGMDCDSVRQPLGVCAGITPFNFPAMVPLWMFPVALACGNTFVFKPSEAGTAHRRAHRGAACGGRPAGRASSTSSTAGTRRWMPSSPILWCKRCRSWALRPSPATSIRRRRPRASECRLPQGRKTSCSSSRTRIWTPPCRG